tara:strand:- start:6691 stop:8547 length:1857 start_codon:yes stop_codon:yes gene_type:complete
MCGIIGIASKKPIADNNWISLGSNNIVHRGPDDSGEWSSDDKKVFFSHRRLSIIDLSASGKQPMHYKNQYSIVLNGEIYNYLEIKKELINDGFKFKTQTDTEVLLFSYIKWGAEWLNKINGMFSFALYDNQKNIIILGRDRAGEKPLYYFSSNNSLRFSSELKGLLSDKNLPRKLNYKALNDYLSIGYINDSDCFLKGYKKLLPGHTLTFDIKSGNIETNRYWKLPDYNASNIRLNEEDLLDEFELLFQKAVKRQLISDVPIGILLSGGLDSSLIAGVASKFNRSIKTFTVKFPNSKRYDESNHAKLISNYFNTDHYEIESDQISRDLFIKLSKQYDEPLIDLSMIPTFLLCQVVKKYCTVAIGGDGGDELFGGYKYYRRILLLKSYMSWLSEKIRRPISKSLYSILPEGKIGKNWINYFGSDLKRNIPLLLNKFDNNAKSTLLKRFVRDKIEDEYNYEYNKIENDIVQLVTRMDFENYLPNDILTKVDRASMLNSLEVRAPILDHKLIEFAFNKIPSSLKFSKNENKIFLKKFGKRILPPEFDYARKQGFEFPISELLVSGDIRNMFEEVLFDENSIFNREMINNLFFRFDQGYKTEEKLFGLAQFELWRNEYSIDI